MLVLILKLNCVTHTYYLRWNLLPLRDQMVESTRLMKKIELLGSLIDPGRCCSNMTLAIIQLGGIGVAGANIISQLNDIFLVKGCYSFCFFRFMPLLWVH